MKKNIRRMSFLLIFMGTALIYLQYSAKGLCEIYFWNNCAFVFCGEGEKCILRFVSLSINKVFIIFFQTLVGFLAILDRKRPIRAGSL